MRPGPTRSGTPASHVSLGRVPDARPPSLPLPVTVDALPLATPTLPGTLAPPIPPPFAGIPAPRWCGLPALGWQARQARPPRARPPLTGAVLAPPVVVVPVSADRSAQAMPAAPSTYAKAAGRLLRWASRAALGATFLILMLATLPCLAGWCPEVITGHSMAPSIERGDLVVVRPDAAGAYRPGVVITFSDPGRPGRLTTHRVVALRPDGRLTTRGDHNRDADPAPVSVGDVRGRVVLRVPWAGRPVVWAMDRRWLPLGASGAILVAAARAALAPSRRPARRRPRAIG